MRKRTFVLGLAVLAAGMLVASLAGASGGKRVLKAKEMSGYQENPDVSTGATGSFRAVVDDDAQTITYTLTYSGLEGGDAAAAHIHLGKYGVNGGVSAFLCGGGDKPVCPAREGTVEGVIDAADVIGPAGQGIAAGEFDELVAAMRAGHTYANVHTPPMWPGGEIRGQINDPRNT